MTSLVESVLGPPRLYQCIHAGHDLFNNLSKVYISANSIFEMYKTKDLIATHVSHSTL